MLDVENHSRNGHNKTSLPEATELSLLKHLSEERETDNSPQAVCTAEELLQTLLSDKWLYSSNLQQFIQKVQQITKSSAKSNSGISILLLDAENLKIDIHSETFLAHLSKYPLQVKIAFANWRNPTMGKQDVELYERGYQLVHVPGGKDSADAKMIALGASIIQQYQTVKEVFVCSGDGILTHLCNQLQNQGLTVYWARRQNHNLQVENRNTGAVSHYSLILETEIPSFEDFVQKIEELLKAERESIQTRLSKLTTIATLFQERCNLTLNAKHSFEPVIQEQEIPPLIKAESTQSLTKENRATNASATTANTPSATIIDSQEVLEKVLIGILKAMKVKSQANVSVGNLAIELNKLSGESANSIVKKLKLGSSFMKFLETCHKFQLKKTGKQYNVIFAQG